MPARDPMFRRGARRNSSLIQSDLQQSLTLLFTQRRSSLSGEVRALLEEPESMRKSLRELPRVREDLTRSMDAMEEFVLQFAKSLLVSLQQLDLGPEEEPKVPIIKAETPQVATLQSDTELREEGKEPLPVQQSAADSTQPKGFPRQSIRNRRGSMPTSRASLKSPQDSRSPSLLSPPLTPSKALVPSLPSDLSLAPTPRRLAPRKSAQLSSLPRRSLISRASIFSKRPKPEAANVSSASEEAEDEVPGSEEDPSPVRNYLAGSADFELKHMEMVKKMAEELLLGNGRKRRARFYNIALGEAEQKQKEAEDVVTSEEETPIPHTPCITYDVKWQKEAEENDLREDVAEKLAFLVQGKAENLHDFAFSAKVNFDFQVNAELGKERAYKNSEDTDKPDDAGMVSAMQREQFYERYKAAVRLDEGGNVLEVIDSGAPSRAEKYALFRRALEKRIKKEKTLRSRSGQEMAKLHAKPLFSFTNLPLPLSTASKHMRSSRSEQLLLDGKASRVQSPRERQERVYLRIKGERDLQRLSRCDSRLYHCKAVSHAVAQLGEIGVRPGSVR